MHRKRLPVGIQTLREIREDDHYYVDKTGYALGLIEEGKYYFLSRPRRFGKSLFLDTLAELFSGNRALFAGLQADGRWDWSRAYPVIRLSFGGGMVGSRAELDFHPWWFETGTPTFLVDVLIQRGFLRPIWRMCVHPRPCYRPSTSTSWHLRRCSGRPAI
jgi:hypothetical protein